MLSARGIAATSQWCRVTFPLATRSFSCSLAICKRRRKTFQETPTNINMNVKNRLDFHSVSIYTWPDACTLSNPPLWGGLWALWAVWLLTADPVLGRDPAPALYPLAGSHSASQHFPQGSGCVLWETYWPATLLLIVLGGPTVCPVFQPTSLKKYDRKKTCGSRLMQMDPKTISQPENANGCSSHSQWPSVYKSWLSTGFLLVLTMHNNMVASEVTLGTCSHHFSRMTNFVLITF